MRNAFFPLFWRSQRLDHGGKTVVAMAAMTTTTPRNSAGAAVWAIAGVCTQTNKEAPYVA